MALTVNSPGLVRNTARNWLGGVCAGVADRTGISPGIVRGAFLLGMLVSDELRVLLVISYVALWVAMPSPQAASAGVRWVMLGTLALSTPFLYLALQADGRMGLGLIALPAVVGVLTAAVRIDRIALKAGFALTGIAITTLLFWLDYKPVVGEMVVRPDSIRDLQGAPHANLFGDVTVDLRQLDSGSTMLRLVGLGSNVRVHLPAHATLVMDGTTYAPSLPVERPLQVTIETEGYVRSFNVLR